MTDEKRLLSGLVSSDEYAALLALRPEFNLFDLLNDALREPAWSRIFSGVLDSTLPHELGNKALLGWLPRIADELRRTGRKLPKAFQHVRTDAIVRSKVEYHTRKGRKVDVLLRILDAKHDVAAVIGIENKLGSPEQPNQIRDYQTALSEDFPQAEKFILYLTPDGREPRTAKDDATCPCLPASYRTMVDTCRSLCRDAAPKVALMLDCLSSEIESAVLEKTMVEKHAEEIVRRLWANPDHRKAIQLIIKYSPTPRKLWETELLDRVNLKLKNLGIASAAVGPVSFYPVESDNPYEIKLKCGGKVGDAAEQAGIVLYYMLDCSDRRRPTIGSEFVLRLMAWCDSCTTQRLAKVAKLKSELPKCSDYRFDSGQQMDIWMGGSYTLRDLDKNDVEGMAKLVCSGVDATWPVLLKKTSVLRQ